MLLGQSGFLGFKEQFKDHRLHYMQTLSFKVRYRHVEEGHCVFEILVLKIFAAKDDYILKQG